MSPPIVVIGASLGGVAALIELARALPAGFPAIVAVVLHIGNRPSILPELLTRAGPLKALHAVDGMAPEPGTIYVAPPDNHLLVEPGRLRLSRGARENHARPALDPLFRTAALGWRERAIGVVLTGELDDGTAGLLAIRMSGGTAIVQDPAEAAGPSMPASALAAVPQALVLPLALIAPALEQKVSSPEPPASNVPPSVREEQAVFEGDDPVRRLSALGRPSQLTCPECGGSLTELAEPPLRFRCHTGHAFTARTLEVAQAELTDEALWNGLRAMREREMLLLRVASAAEGTGQPEQARLQREEATRLHQSSLQLSSLLQAPSA